MSKPSSARSIVRSRRVLVVGYDAELSRDRAGLGERGREQEPVRLVDLPGLERLAGLAKLRAGHEDPDPRTLPALDLVDTRCRKSADLRRAELGPRLEHRLAGTSVAAAPADVGARLDCLRAPSIVPSRSSTSSSGTTASAPSGTTPPVETRHRLAGLERAVSRASGRDSRDHGE